MEEIVEILLVCAELRCWDTGVCRVVVDLVDRAIHFCLLFAILLVIISDCSVFIFLVFLAFGIFRILIFLFIVG